MGPIIYYSVILNFTTFISDAQTIQFTITLMMEESAPFIEFQLIGESLPDVARGQMFGKQCLKYHKKAFACFFEDAMVFKLSGVEHLEALGLDEAKLFDPSGNGRPMKAWVQVSYKHQKQWMRYAEIALELLKTKI